MLTSLTHANKPEQFEEGALRIGARAQVRPMRESAFQADLRFLPLEKGGLVAVRAAPITVSIDLSPGLVGMTIPAGKPFVARDRGKSRLFDRHEAHLFGFPEKMSLVAEHGCQVLGVNLMLGPLRKYSCKLNQSDNPLKVQSSLSLSSPSGISLQRALAKLWSEFESAGTGLTCEIARKELEDELIATFILALDPGESESGAGHSVVPNYLGIAEEYILANLNRVVTREKLAETAGVSIRTLSRAFMKRYGTGPIGYLKQRRLDAAYRDLTGAKPGSCSVTEIALKYGFTHFGKFSIDYRKVFGESPSTSLSH